MICSTTQVTPIHSSISRQLGIGKTIAVLTSGGKYLNLLKFKEKTNVYDILGDAQGMNAAVRAVVR